MPGRTGYRVEGGWAQDGTSSSGVPSSLSISSRTNNTPPEYVASQEIEFTSGFESGTGDAFEAYISDGSSGSGGGTGAGSGYAGGGYRYGFNGKENDNEVKGEGNNLDFGNRMYDSRLGRFLSCDRVSSNTPFYSPYLFAGNKPIVAIDQNVDIPVQSEPPIPVKVSHSGMVDLCFGKCSEKSDSAESEPLCGGIGVLPFRRK